MKNKFNLNWHNMSYKNPKHWKNLFAEMSNLDFPHTFVLQNLLTISKTRYRTFYHPVIFVWLRIFYHPVSIRFFYHKFSLRFLFSCKIQKVLQKQNLFYILYNMSLNFAIHWKNILFILSLFFVAGSSKNRSNAQYKGGLFFMRIGTTLRVVTYWLR